ncbi:hypothetical protein J6590_026407 [Homalodisca vitripennis]|nr:hypothetical protein J6590_026407 [Homalodisca vitripennis]
MAKLVKRFATDIAANRAASLQLTPTQITLIKVGWAMYQPWRGKLADEAQSTISGVTSVRASDSRRRHRRKVDLSQININM